MTNIPASQRSCLDMNIWPKLIEVAIPINESWSSRRGTADLLRWSIEAEPRYGQNDVENLALATTATKPIDGPSASPRGCLPVRAKRRA